jgi:hypothetical protein
MGASALGAGAAKRSITAMLASQVSAAHSTTQLKKREHAARKAFAASLPLGKNQFEELAREQTFDKDNAESQEEQGNKMPTIA